MKNQQPPRISDLSCQCSVPVCHYSVISFMSYACPYHTRYGSVSQYLVSAGFTEEEQEKLRAVFFHPKEEEDVEEMKEEED